MAYKSQDSHRQYQLMMSKIVSKSHSPHVLETTPTQHRKREDLVESTGVVPAKYPPQVKLGNFHHFRVPELG